MRTGRSASQGLPSGKRVLLVEDNDLNVEIAEIFLDDTGLTVDTARNGKEAVRRSQARSRARSR